MKIVVGILGALVIIGGVWYGIASSPTTAPTESVMEKDHSENTEKTGRPGPGTYTAIAEKSMVAWAASKPLIPGYTHRGTISVSEGVIEVGNETAAGSFVLDMNSLTVTSLGGGKAGRESQLESHLKDGDFFDVANHPAARFEVAKVIPTETPGAYSVTGTLTMKGVANELTIPARIYMENGMLHIHADFTIDRTRWGITFGSPSIFSNLAENAIGDEVTLSLTVIAQPDAL